MENKNPGNQSLRVKQIEENLDAYLLDFETSLGFNDSNHEAIKLTKLTPEEYKQFNANTAAEAALVLSSYAIFLQDACAKIGAKIKGCTKRVNDIIVDRLKQQKAYNYEERRLSAIKEDTAASEYYKLQTELEIKYERLSFLSSKFQHYSDKFSELSKILNRRGV